MPWVSRTEELNPSQTPQQLLKRFNHITGPQLDVALPAELRGTAGGGKTPALEWIFTAWHHCCPLRKNRMMRWESRATASFGLMGKKCRQTIFRWKHENILLELNSEPTCKSKNRCKNTFSRKICLKFSKKCLEDALPYRLRPSWKMNQQPLLSNLQTLVKAVCTPTGALGMLWVGTAMPWSSIHVNENSNQTFGKQE